MPELDLEPDECITFYGPYTEKCNTEFKISNDSPKRLAFKVKCTSNKLFRLRPVVGFIEGNGAEIAVTVTFKGSKEKKGPPTEQHYVGVVEFEPKPTDMNARRLWESDAAKAVPMTSNVLRVEFLDYGVPPPGRASGITPAVDADVVAPSPAEKVQLLQPINAEK